jgi:hypothetical protein
MPTTGKEEDLTTSTQMLVCRPYYTDQLVVTRRDENAQPIQPPPPPTGQQIVKTVHDSDDSYCQADFYVLLFVIFCVAGPIIMSFALNSGYPLFLWAAIPCCWCISQLYDDFQIRHKRKLTAEYAL